jgi:hypothetical protein
MPDPTLSAEDLLALHHTQQQLAAAGDPRAEKLRAFIVQQGHASLDAQPKPVAAAGFTPGNIVSNVGRGLKELGQGAVQLASDVGGVILPQKFGGDPITDTQLMHHVVDPMQAEAAKARQGGPGSAGHAIASGIPVIGPYAANLGEQAASGDVGGALTRGITQYAAPKAIAPAIAATGRVAGRAALLGKTPEAAYESALKPSTTLGEAERAAIVKTGLENEIPVSKTGLEKIGAAIDELNNQITDEIKPGVKINPNRAALTADQAKAKFANQVNANGDLAAIEASKQQFLREQGAKPGSPSVPPQPTGVLDAQGNPVMSAGTPAKPATPAPPMEAAKAQAMKVGTYRVLKGKYGEQGSASVEAQKALARGLKDEIANAFPEISKLNAAESKLLDLQPVLERAVNRNANHQLVGIGTPVAAGAAKAVTGSSGIGAVVGTLKAVLDNPVVKSRLAIAISKGAKIPIATAISRVQTYVASLGSYAEAQGSAANGDNSANPPTQ